MATVVKASFPSASNYGGILNLNDTKSTSPIGLITSLISGYLNGAVERTNAANLVKKQRAFVDALPDTSGMSADELEQAYVNAPNWGFLSQDEKTLRLKQIEQRRADEEKNRYIEAAIASGYKQPVAEMIAFGKGINLPSEMQKLNHEFAVPEYEFKDVDTGKQINTFATNKFNQKPFLVYSQDKQTTPTDDLNAALTRETNAANINIARGHDAASIKSASIHAQNGKYKDDGYGNLYSTVDGSVKPNPRVNLFRIQRESLQKTTQFALEHLSPDDERVKKFLENSNSAYTTLAENERNLDLVSQTTGLDFQKSMPYFQAATEYAQEKGVSFGTALHKVIAGQK